MHHDDDNWIGLVHGVHDLEYNSKLSVYLDTRHIFIFATDGDLIHTASYVQER